MLANMGWSSRMLPWPLGEGNCVSLKSLEADSRLLCRSSKLTEGRKSNEVVVESFTSSWAAPPSRPKENREWLLEDEALSIGTLGIEDVVVVPVALGVGVWSAGLVFSRGNPGGDWEW